MLPVYTLCLSFHDSLPVYHIYVYVFLCLFVHMWGKEAVLESECSQIVQMKNDVCLCLCVCLYATGFCWLDSVPAVWQTHLLACYPTTVAIRIANCAFLHVDEDTLCNLSFFWNSHNKRVLSFQHAQAIVLFLECKPCYFVFM